MIGFHLDDTEKENYLREESLYNTNGKTFERVNHNKTWVYNEKTGWSIKDKQEENKCTK